MLLPSCGSKIIQRGGGVSGYSYFLIQSELNQSNTALQKLAGCFPTVNWREGGHISGTVWQAPSTYTPEIHTYPPSLCKPFPL